MKLGEIVLVIRHPLGAPGYRAYRTPSGYNIERNECAGRSPHHKHRPRWVQLAFCHTMKRVLQYIASRDEFSK